MASKHVTCPRCSHSFPPPPPAVRKARKSKADLSDDAVIARTSQARWIPLESVLARLIGGSFNVSVPVACAYCKASVPADSLNYANVCEPCREAIEAKSGIWQAVNDQRMNYTEAVAQVA